MTNISVIDERRRAAGVTQKELCRRARVNATTYTALKLGHRGGYADTFARLDQALKTIETEKRKGTA